VARAMIRLVILGVVPIAALLTGAHYWVASGRYVATDNAYVKANLIAISAEVSGRVDRVLVAENALVIAGQNLFSIDPEPFRIELTRATAELDKVGNLIAALRADYRQSEMELKEARADVAYFKRVQRRFAALARRGNASRAKLDEADRNVDTSGQRASALRQKTLRILARLGGRISGPIERHSEYLEAKANRDKAELNLRRTMVSAPVGGHIGRLKLQAGEYFRAGETMLPLIESGSSWIEANLKETQLTHVKIGQRARIVLDAFPDHAWDATVMSISPWTGAELSILPPQNASGNWVKVVQRIPVRLEIGAIHPSVTLRSGMTVSVAIDTGRTPSLIGVIGDALAWKSARE
jgi:membrane fusion protein (multidrug efflux system)